MLDKIAERFISISFAALGLGAVGATCYGVFIAYKTHSVAMLIATFVGAWLLILMVSICYLARHDAGKP